MGLFTDLFSTQPAEDAARDKVQGLNTANTNAGADLTAGQATADAGYGKAEGLYGDLASSTKGGFDAYGDATGANGADGIARAGNQFKSITGYNGGLNTGIDTVDRLAAAHGGFGGGNNTGDLIKFASDYDDTHYKDYTAGLAPYLGLHSGAVGSEAGAYGTQAGADLGVAGQRASNDYNTGVGIGNAKADADTAKYSASSNFWNSLLGGAKLAVSAATGMPTGSTSFSGPSYGGGSALTGDAYGGSSKAPLPGLDASDYGAGF